MKQEINTTYKPGSSQEVTLHDGSFLHLHKTDDKLDIHDRQSALNRIQDYRSEGNILTGLLYVDPNSNDLHKRIDTNTSNPLRNLNEADLCPGNKVLQNINKSLQ